MVHESRQTKGRGVWILVVQDLAEGVQSITNLDPAETPTVSVPVTLANHAADWFFDVDRFRRIVNRRRRSRTQLQCRFASREAGRLSYLAIEWMDGG